MTLNKLYKLNLLFWIIILVIPTKLVSFNLEDNNKSDSILMESNKQFKSKILVMGNMNFLIFDKFESEPIYYNKFSPTVKFTLQGQHNLGIGLEFSPFLSKTSLIRDNLSLNETIKGQYYVYPIILSFNYEIDQFNLFFGFGYSIVQSSIYSGTDLIYNNYSNSVVYTYGMDYTVILINNFHFGTAVKGFYHNNIEKFNVQIGCYLEYVISF